MGIVCSTLYILQEHATEVDKQKYAMTQNVQFVKFMGIESQYFLPHLFNSIQSFSQTPIFFVGFHQFSVPFLLQTHTSLFIYMLYSVGLSRKQFILMPFNNNIAFVQSQRVKCYSLKEMHAEKTDIHMNRNIT